MELRSGYKQTDVGVIPSDWSVSTVGQEFEIKLGKMIDAEKNVGVLKPYLGNKAIQWDRIDISDLPTVPMTRTDIEKYRLRQGDLLVCEGGEVGRAAIWNSQINECYYQKALHRLRPKHGFDPRLMAALLGQWSARGLLVNYVTQTSIAHLPKEKFIEIPLPVPPLAEQQAIAEALSDVDELLAALDAALAKKRDLKQAAMQQLLTGEIRLPGFQGEWEVKRLENILNIDPENLGGDTEPDFSFNYISLEDVDRGVKKGHSEHIFSKAPSRARRKLRFGDVLVSTVRPNLRSHLIFKDEDGAWVCSTGFCVLRCRQGVVHPDYIFWHFFADCVNQQIEAILTGSNYPAINSADVRSLQIPFPSFPEQNAIAQVLSDMDADLTLLTQRPEGVKLFETVLVKSLVIYFDLISIS